MKSKNTNIVLIGLMGSGKTIASKILAQKLNIERFSTDEIIETQEKATIAEIVKEKGWPYFREIEHSIVKNLAFKKGVVIDCGGGVVLNPENLALLKKNGIVFHLDAKPDVIYERLKGDTTRPLINDSHPRERIEALYKERFPLYSQSDFAIDASGSSMEAAVEEILKKV